MDYLLSKKQKYILENGNGIKPFLNKTTMEDRKYIKYIGQYVKRFYTSFKEEDIWELGGYREVTYFYRGRPLAPRSEFHYRKGREEFWSDAEDSIIISNEEIISDDEKVANVNHPDYKGYNPFS